MDCYSVNTVGSRHSKAAQPKQLSIIMLNPKLNVVQLPRPISELHAVPNIQQSPNFSSDLSTHICYLQKTDTSCKCATFLKSAEALAL